MIPLPGILLFVWLLEVSAVLSGVSLILMAGLVWLARRKTARGRPAHGERRIALGAVVWSAIWVVLAAGTDALLHALLPLLVCVIGFYAVSRINSRAGFPPGPLVRSGVLSFGLALLFIAMMALVTSEMRAHRTREEARQLAAARSRQNRFSAVSVLPSGHLAVVGTTSTPPGDKDDVWLYTISDRHEPAAHPRDVRPGDQSGLAVAVISEKEWIIGGQDREHPFLSHLTPGGARVNRLWDVEGLVAVVLPLGEHEILVGGRQEGAAWVARVGTSAPDHWNLRLPTRIEYPQVMSVALAGDRFVAVGSDYLFGRGAFYAGGTIDGSIEWIHDRQGPGDGQGEDGEAAHVTSQETWGLCAVSSLEDGTFVALGQRSVPGRMEDLWLLHLALDGSVIGEWTFGGSGGEWPGSLEIRGEQLILAGQRFLGAEEDLWLLSVGLDGDALWERTYAAAEYGRVSDLALTPEGDIVAVGYRATLDKTDGWIARFDGAGNLLWQRVFPEGSRTARIESTPGAARKQ